MIFQASEQQMNIFRWVRDGEGHAMVQALAGTGKTTTIIEAIRYMQGSVALVAYNKKIAEELQAKIKNRMGKKREDMRAGTFHSFGFSAWIRRHPGMKMEGDSERSVGYWKWDRILELLEIPKPDKPLSRCARKLLSLAKQYGFGIEGIEPDDNPARWKWLFDHFNLQDELFDEDTGYMPKPDEIEKLMKVAIVLARRALLKGIEIAPEVIDFDDMLYMPLREPTCRIWQYDWVLIDECQDSNPVRRMFAKKMMRAEGRSIWIGDQNQAIYGFGGADSESMNVIQEQFSPTLFPLTTTYRCSLAVVRYARQWTPDMEPRPEAPEGAVKTIEAEKLLGEDLKNSDAILCRNTAPLVDLALKLIRSGRGCKVEGRDIGQNLWKLAERWKRVKTVQILAERLKEYRNVQVAILKKRGKDMQAEQVGDTVDSLLAIIESLPSHATLWDLRQKINGMFGDTEAGKPQTLLTLSTIHKAKGREWPRVFWWGYNVYNPSPYATQEWEKEQEENLMYVAATRPIDTLVKVFLKAKKEEKPVYTLDDFDDHHPSYEMDDDDRPKWNDMTYRKTLIQQGLMD
jgi:superfamily I DNA/RNA helicase